MLVCDLNTQRFAKYENHVPKYGTIAERVECDLYFKRSQRWLPQTNLSTKVRVRSFPFLSGGHITGCSMLHMECSSAQWFATMVNSVFKALESRVHLRTYGRRKWNTDLISRVAIFYVVTMNDYLLERILRTSGNPRKAIEKYIHTMDDQKRFLYGQACLHAKWFKSRGSKIPRVKSITKCFAHEYRNFGLRNYGVNRQLSTYLDWLSDPWIVNPLRFETPRIRPLATS